MSECRSEHHSFYEPDHGKDEIEFISFDDWLEVTPDWSWDEALTDLSIEVQVDIAKQIFIGKLGEDYARQIEHNLRADYDMAKFNGRPEVIKHD